MSKKVLLVSLWGNRNYGNKLQSYALSKLLKAHNCDVTIAQHDEPFPLIDRIKNKVKLVLSFCGVKKYSSYKSEYIRENNFRTFNKCYIEKSIYIRNFKISSQVEKKYDFAITGSDQVWHGWFGKDSELDFYFLRFMPYDKRISYSASFGISSLPENKLDTYKNGLNGIKYLSVRDNSARILIKRLTGREALVIPDPVFGITRNEWRELQKSPQTAVKKEYILLYFLGDIEEKIRESVNKLAEDYLLDIIDLSDKENYEKTTPDIFLYYVDNAKYVFTDSFHAVAFSIIFNTNFWVSKREQEGFSHMFDRIETLLTKFDLQDRIFQKSIKINNLIDYEKINSILEILLSESNEYINKVLNDFCG